MQHPTEGKVIWRIVRNRRPIGKRYILQQGMWVAPSRAGYSKGIYSRFRVNYEEFHDSVQQATASLVDQKFAADGSVLEVANG